MPPYGADRILIGIVAFNLAYAVLGVSLGALVRNLTAAVAIALVWIVLVESTAANLLGDLGRWLPNRAGMGLNAMAAIGLLPQWGAALVLAGYTAVFAAVALTTAMPATSPELGQNDVACRGKPASKVASRRPPPRHRAAISPPHSTPIGTRTPTSTAHCRLASEGQAPLMIMKVTQSGERGR